MAKRTKGTMTLIQRLNAEATLAKLNRQIEKLSEQRVAVEAKLAADTEARLKSGELVMRGRAA